MRRTLVHHKMGKVTLALLLVQKTPPFSPYPFKQWTCACAWGKVVELTLTLTEQLTACSRLVVQSQQVAKIHCQQIGLLTLANASGQGAIPWGGIYFPI